ncbi:YgfZ/GcvT domain-containing protein [Marinobacterium sp. YM272]|uniref:CAF17-like 4Fe-4S cluster assembly/insertion protein YgfZ n=1 Tax=Marinobacterium sp. YM272 TaxID=3421654 RepID=UPI003D7FB491
MNTAWQEKLQTLGYTFDEQGVATAPAPFSGEGSALVPLTHQRIISINGPESEKFLQGQLSCDIGDVDRIGSRLGSHCNIKGHMISLFRVIRQSPECLHLRSDAGNADKALATIKKYILFSKAEAQLNDELVGLGLFGSDAAQLASQIVATLPDEVDGVSVDNERLLVKLPGDNRFECWLPADQAIELIDTLKQGASLAGCDDWLLEEIRAGLPDLRADTSEAFIPQMTNLQALNGVSFTKGCYTGQEVVTRLQHRGILKKPMYRASVTAAERPAPGQALHSEAKENIGQVVIAAPTGGDNYELLAVITKEQADNSTIHLESTEGPALSLLELPYTLDPRLFESKR